MAATGAVVERDALPADADGEASRFDAWACRVLLAGLQAVGAVLCPGHVTQLEGLRARVHPQHGRLLDELVATAEAAGFCARTDGGAALTAAPSLPPTDAASLKAEGDALAALPATSAAARLLAATGPGLAGVLTGARTAADVLFPRGSPHLVEAVYKDDLLSAPFNHQLAAAVLAYAGATAGGRAAGRPLRVLEVGSGSGGTSAPLLAALAGTMPAGGVEFTYTDLSPALVAYGRKTYGPTYPFATFRPLDLEADLAAQGYALGSHDVVLATNVLHATADLGATLAACKALLAEGGLLLANELTAKTPFLTLTFGLTDGWWLYDDARRGIPGAYPGARVVRAVGTQPGCPHKTSSPTPPHPPPSDPL